MEVHRQFSVRTEKLLFGATQLPSPPATNEGDQRLEVTVIFTSAEATIVAMATAASLLSGLNGHISLVGPQAVPYPLPLEDPPVPGDFSERRLLEIASVSPVETTVRLYLCRDRWEILPAVLKPRSLAVVGSRKRRWSTWEKSLARKLRRDGHEVVFIETA
jgi:hypothetical protein